LPAPAAMPLRLRYMLHDGASAPLFIIFATAITLMLPPLSMPDAPG